MALLLQYICHFCYDGSKDPAGATDANAICRDKDAHDAALL